MEHDKVQENLRDKLLKEAGKAIRGLEKREDILAAILTGSAAWGKPNPDGDLDILLITEGRKGVLYRYLIPAFCPVERRTELGYIPHDTVVRNIEKGYDTTLSCSMIEQLKNGRILFQRNSHGDHLIESCRRVPPSKITIGGYINDIGDILGEMRAFINAGRFKEAILVMRRMARLSARALLLAREKTGVSKEKHEYRAVRRHLSKDEGAEYEALTGIAGMDRAGAVRVLEDSISLVKWALQGRSISTVMVNYGGKK